MIEPRARLGKIASWFHTWPARHPDEFDTLDQLSSLTGIIAFVGIVLVVVLLVDLIARALA